MAVIGRVVPRNQKTGEGKNHLQKVLKEELLQACQPSTAKGETMLRIIPEVTAKGEILPMVVGKSADGLDFSGMVVENIIIDQGRNAKCTMIATPSDRPDLDESELPWSTTFIRLRGQEKKKEIDPAFETEVKSLLARPAKDRPAALSQVREMLLCQCVMVKFNGKVLEKPKGKVAAFLSVSAVQALNEVLSRAHNEGLDVFSPENGRLIKFTPRPQRGSGIMMFDAELGDKFPIKADKCRSLWVPWEGAIIRHPMKTHFQRLCASYGRRLVEYVFGAEYTSEALEEEREASKPSRVSSPSGPSAREEPRQEAATDMQMEIDDDTSTVIEEEDESFDSDPTDAPAGCHDSGFSSYAEGPEDAEALAKRFEEML